MGNLRIGEFVIMMDCECPEARMVVVLTSYAAKTGIWHGRYISAYPNMSKCFTSTWTPTRVSDFGMEIELSDDGKQFRCVPNGKPCVARYEDLTPRKWQDRMGDRWHDIRMSLDEKTLDMIKKAAKAPVVTAEK